jgi:hypothetical protein
VLVFFREESRLDFEDALEIKGVSPQYLGEVDTTALRSVYRRIWIDLSDTTFGRCEAALIERPVRAETVPRESWEQIFRSQGTRNPLPRIRMLDGFNEGWIEFSEHGRSAVKGTTALESVIAELVRASQAQAST